MNSQELIEYYKDKIYVNIHRQERNDRTEYFLQHESKVLCISFGVRKDNNVIVYHLSYNNTQIDFDSYYHNQSILQEFYLLIERICYLNVKFLRIKNDLKFELNKSLMSSDLPNRFEEFEVIKDQSIDLISLNSLFDYYNMPFNSTRYQ